MNSRNQARIVIQSDLSTASINSLIVKGFAMILHLPPFAGELSMAHTEKPDMKSVSISG